MTGLQLTCRFVVDLSGRLGSAFDEKSFAVGQQGSIRVENLCHGPVLASFIAGDPAFKAQRGAGRHGSQVVYLHVPGHRGVPGCSDSFAHDLVKQGGDNAAVQIADRPFIGVGNCWKADDGAVLGEQELEVQPFGIGQAAAEAAVLRGVGDWGQVLLRFCHLFSTKRGWFGFEVPHPSDRNKKVARMGHPV